jgi:HPt (histidine-containing phosphotransfer) domain-containing protein
LLESALVNSDQEQARVQAHTIKGAAANISAQRMQKTAAEMENHARNGRVDEAAALLHQLKDEFTEFKGMTAHV